MEATPHPLSDGSATPGPHTPVARHRQPAAVSPASKEKLQRHVPPPLVFLPAASRPSPISIIHPTRSVQVDIATSPFIFGPPLEVETPLATAVTIPMSVDPRSSAEGPSASWPHALHPREAPSQMLLSTQPQPSWTHEAAVPRNIPEDTPEPSTVYPHTVQRRPRRHTPSAQHPLSLFNPPSSPETGPTALPFAKACHNYLLVTKTHLAKRRRQKQEAALRRIEAEAEAGGERRVGAPRPSQPNGHGYLNVANASLHNDRAGLSFDQATVQPWSFIGASTHMNGATANADTSTSGTQGHPIQQNTITIRSLPSIARIDESRPPRKRRRSRSPESDDDTSYPYQPSPVLRTTISRLCPPYHPDPLANSHAQRSSDTLGIIPFRQETQTQEHQIHPIRLPPSDLTRLSTHTSPCGGTRLTPRRPWTAIGPISAYTLASQHASDQGDGGWGEAEEEREARRVAWVEGEQRRLEGLRTGKRSA
jgi:hypothetical protein